MGNTPRDWDEVLDECLDRVVWRSESVERCLADYPEYGDELRAFLQAAQEARRAFNFVPQAARKRTARQRFFAALERHQRHPRLLSSWWFRGWHRWATAAAAVLVVLVLGGGGAVAASDDSVPGEPMYPVKRTAEQVRLTLALPEEDKAQLHAEYAQRRAWEISTLARQGATKHLPALNEALERNLAQAHRLAGIQGDSVASGPGARPDAIGPGPVVKPVGSGGRPQGQPGPDQERLQQMFSEKFRRNHEMLEELLERVPPAARPALERAQQRMRQAYEETQEALQHRQGRGRGDTPAGQPHSLNIRGILVDGDHTAQTVGVRLANGRMLTLRSTPDTSVTLNGRTVAPEALRPGDRLKVQFDSSTNEAVKIEAKRGGPRDGDLSGNRRGPASPKRPTL